MNELTIIDIVRQGLMTVVFASAPPLLCGLVMGVTVSIFQTVTSIQEPTLAFVPKILAVFLAIYLFGPWMLGLMRDYFFSIITNMRNYVTF